MVFHWVCKHSKEGAPAGAVREEEKGERGRGREGKEGRGENRLKSIPLLTVLAPQPGLGWKRGEEKKER